MSVNGVADYDKREVVAAVRAARARTLARLEAIEEKEWEVEVTPGWRVREVAAHLISTDEASLTGRLLALGLKQVPMEQLERWNDEQVKRWADKPIPALLHALDVWGRRLARAIATPPARLTAKAIASPLGKVSINWLGMLRVYDEWVHGEDLRRALGLPDDDALDAVEPAARHLFATIPVQTLPELPADAGGCVRLSFTDLTRVPAFGVDMAAHRYGYGLCPEGASIAAPAKALIMIAAGRDRWRDAEQAGVLTITGDRANAELFLDHLRAV